jgi:hypothetical protein
VKSSAISGDFQEMKHSLYIVPLVRAHACQIGSPRPSLVYLKKGI